MKIKILFIIIVALFLFVGCNKPQWYETDQGVLVYSKIDGVSCQWDGPSSLALAQGEGVLTVFDKNGSMVERFNASAIMGIVGDYEYSKIDNCLYLGATKKGQPHGFGVLIDDNGWVRVGRFKKGAFEGGDENFLQEKAVEGRIENGILFPDYFGYMKNGEPHGFGIHYNQFGNIEYEGDWKNGVRAGFGRSYNYTGGAGAVFSYYEGKFSDGKPNGSGKLVKCIIRLSEETLEDEEVTEIRISDSTQRDTLRVLVYEGGWKDGQMHGKGKSYDEQGNLLYEGSWKNGKYDGKGTIYKDGKCIQAKFERGAIIRVISESGSNSGVKASSQSTEESGMEEAVELYNKKAKKTLTWIIILSILGSGVAVLVVWRQRLIIKQRKREERERKREERERKEKERIEENLRRAEEARIREAEKERNRLLSFEKSIREMTFVPIESGSFKAEYVGLTNSMLSVINECEYIKKTTHDKILKGISLTPSEKEQRRQSIYRSADASLCLFYGVSLKVQCDKLKVPFSSYQEALTIALSDPTKTLPLRTDDDELDILKHIPTHQLVQLEQLSRFSLGAGIHGYIKELNDIAQRDTSGIMGESLDLLAQKTSDMDKVFLKIRNEVKSLKDWCVSINKVLDVARIEAYRNQYLGEEILSICRLSSDDSRSVEKSAISINQLNIPNITFSTKDFNVSFGDVAGKFVDVMDAMSGLNIRSGKGQAVAAVAGIAMAAISARNEKVEQNIQQQQRYISYSSNIVSKIENTIAQRKRAIDVIRSIVVANDAFMAFYIPLRNEIFVNKKSPSQIEGIDEQLNNIKTAISAYKKISSKRI